MVHFIDLVSNRIVVCRKSYEQFAISEHHCSISNWYSDDFDCDLIFGKRNVSFGEAHGIFDKRPVYVSRTDADFRLADGSPGKGAAVYLDNFNEIYGADMGAKQ